MKTEQTPTALTRAAHWWASLFRGTRNADSILRHSRLVAIAAGLLYPLLQLHSPEEARDPIWGRIAISAVLIGACASTYLSPWAARRSRTLLSLGLWLLTAHFYSLNYYQPTTPSHIAGIFALVVVVSSLQHHRLLLPYFAYVIVLAGILSLSHLEQGLGPLLPVTLSACTLALLTVGGFARLVGELDDSRQNLERRVARRTKALSKSNASILEQLRCAKALNKITEQITIDDTPEPILSSLAQVTGEALDADHALVLFLPKKKERLEILSKWSALEREVPLERVRGFPLAAVRNALTRFENAPTILVSYANDREPLLTEGDADHYIHDKLGAQSLICFSFGHDGEGYHIGVVVQTREPRIWSDTTFDFLRSASHHVEIALQKMKLIEESRRSQAALRESAAQLRQSQKMDAMGRLAGGIAHDFNNLLTAIRGYSELVHSGLEVSSPLRSDVEEIQQASDRAAALVEQLLTFSRQEPRERQVTNLSTLVAQIEQMLQRVLGKEIEIRSELSTGNTHIEVNPGQLEQMLLNLAVNARDAMPEGGRLTLRTRILEDATPSVYFALGNPETLVRLEVIDTGCGMEEDTVARIFEPFFTTKAVGKGTGLGLSMVYGIVQQNLGQISVESAPGRGSTFQLDFPQVTKRADPLPTEAVETLDRGGRETLLFVEDEESVRSLTTRILRRSGYDVLEAANGQEALELFETRNAEVDLLLTDVIMPEMNGPELARRLTQHTPSLKVLYISGYADANFRSGGRIPENATTLPKPFSPQQLNFAVRATLDRDSEASDADPAKREDNS